MGEDVDAQEFSRADRTRYREKVHRCLDTFARMLSEHQFDTDDPMTGMEVELNLVDELGDPALKNAEALAAIADPAFQTELGQFNIEINVPPAKLREGGLATFEANLRRSLNDAEAKSSEVGAHLVMIGILPTLQDGHLSPSHMSANPRYRLISEQILAARGEDIHIDITGPERLVTTADSILPEAACTSTQFHVQTSPDQFAAYWNASQAISAILLAVGANSPYALGKELWRETRIPMFEQAADTRSEELKAQGVRPRVWFGERWITSVFDLFEENVRYFPALLPITDDEDPVAVFDAGGTPQLSRAAPAQRHDLPLEPPDLRHPGRPPAPAGREPRAARRPDRRRPDGQRRVLLRAGAHARRERAAAVVADVVQGRRGELRGSGRARHRRRGLLAAGGAGPRDRADPAPAAADGPARPRHLGSAPARSPTGCSASSSSAA